MLSFLKKWYTGIVFLLIVLPAVVPLINKGFLVTDDGDWMVIRLSAFHETLRSGQFPVRFLERLNHGYGYPVLNFNYPLPFYLGEAIHLLGFSFIDSTKILFGLSFAAGSLIVGLWLKRKWGVLSGLCGATLYTYANYHLLDIYSRGSLGEAVAFIFLPLVFYCLDLLAEKQTFYRAIVLGISLALFITSHNIIVFISLPCIFFYALLQLSTLKQKKSLLLLQIISCLVGLAISCFFWLPALFELQFTRAGTTHVSQFSSYFLSSDNILTLVGPGVLLVSLVFLSTILKIKDITVFYFFVILAVSLFFASPFSNILWTNSPLPLLIQYPWRFIFLTVIASSYVLAGLVIKIRNKYLTFLIIIAVITIGLWQTKVTNSSQHESFYTTNDDTTTIKNEYMPKWVISDPKNLPASHLEFVSATGSIISKDRVDIASPGLVRINEIYFPGQTVFVDGTRTPATYETDGLLHVWVDRGQHLIKTQFEETPLRKTADLISLIGISISCLVMIKSSRESISKHFKF